MMKNYMENQEKAKLFHEQRKNELLKQNILDNISTINNNIDDAKSELEKVSGSCDDEKKIIQNIESFEEQIKKMEEKKKEIEEQIEIINEDLKNFSIKNKIMPKIIE
jgi:DNA repair exonuclease SbcCD ATPase subunit